MSAASRRFGSMTRMRIEVRSNFAVSLDGQIATAAGEPASFGSAEDRREMARLRAWSDAVLVGAATLRADDPTLGIFDARLRAARRSEGRPDEPLRCVVTRGGKLSKRLRFFRHASERPPIVFAPREAARRLARALGESATVIESPGASVSPRAVVEALSKRHGVRSLLIEGGGDLHFDFLRAGLVNEIRVTLAPVLLGGEDGAPRLVGGAGFPADAVPRLELVSLRRGKTETFLAYRVEGTAPLERRPAPPWTSKKKKKKKEPR